MKKTSRPRGMTADEVVTRVNVLAPSFLAGLAPHEAAEILKAGTSRRVPANTLIIIDEGRADELFLLLDGRARYFATTSHGIESKLARILPGEVIGASSVLSDHVPYLMNAEAVEECSVLVWGRSQILSLAKRYPKLLENALLVVYGYMRYWRDIYLSLSSYSAEQRIALAIERATREIGCKVPGGTEIKVRNEDLASEANTTIFTVSRILSGWQREGWLAKGRGKLILHSVEKLVNDSKSRR